MSKRTACGLVMKKRYCSALTLLEELVAVHRAGGLPFDEVTVEMERGSRTISVTLSYDGEEFSAESDDDELLEMQASAMWGASVTVKFSTNGDEFPTEAIDVAQLHAEYGSAIIHLHNGLQCSTVMLPYAVRDFALAVRASVKSAAPNALL